MPPSSESLPICLICIYPYSLRGWIYKPLLLLFISIPIGMLAASTMELQLLLCPIHQCYNPTTKVVTTAAQSCPSDAYLL